MTDNKIYNGSCFCGAVQLTVSGAPAAAGAVIPEFPYRASVHVHYGETKLRIKDGLPKLRNVPKEMGGSGVDVAE
jgi:hypothetical protein